MNKQEIEDYINTYRVYPEEYTGVRDDQIIVIITESARLNRKTGKMIQRFGRINEEGNFELGAWYTFPIGRPEERVPFNRLDIDHIIEYYNRLVTEAGFSDRTMGSQYTENWNLRDMVAEMDYIRSTFYEPGHVNNKMRTGDPKAWLSFIDRIGYFLRKYREHIGDLVAHTTHNSKFD